MEHRYGKYRQQALEMGAVNAVLVTIDDVVFDPRTYLKCMYGCGDWGKSWVCPSAPGALKPWEAKEVLQRYKAGLLIHTHDKMSSQEISFAIESRAYVDGFYFAFSMSDCGLCRECSYQSGEPCRNPRRARPAMQAMGIDVFETVRRLGLPLQTLATDDQQQNWYSLVLFE